MNKSVYIAFCELAEVDYRKAVEIATDRLPLALHKRFSDYLRLKDKALSCTAWLLLDAVLRQQTQGNVELLHHLEITAMGKPLLPQPYHFNLSHSGNIAVCAFTTNAAIGIDIEKHRKISESEKEYLFQDQNLSQFQSSPRSESFFDLWTRKESFLKACGIGLSDINIKTSTKGTTITIHDKGRNWYCETISNFRDEYSLSICMGEMNGSVETVESYIFR